MAGSARRRAGALFLSIGLVAALVGVFALPAQAAPKEDSECAGAFSGNPESSLAITADPADGSFVEAGDEIEVTATWDTADWVGTELDKLLGCVRINGALAEALTQEEKPVANNGTFTFDAIVVPSDVEDGDEICMRARLSGQPSGDNQSTQKSNVVCWIVGDSENPPPPAPTVSLTVSKNVVNGAGGESFAFTVDCDPVQLSDDNTDDDGVTFDDGVASFSLADDESVTFEDLPEDTSCQVTETVPSGTWTTTINGASDEDRSAVIELGDDDGTAAFENTRVVAPPAPQQEEGAAVLGNEQARASETPAAPAVLAAAETPAAVAPANLARTGGTSFGLVFFGGLLILLGAVILGLSEVKLRPLGRHYHPY